ncbi:hypothetical protein KR009_011322 [Drosophila setifemur]|nr:hypothetical protein KR009_011322 [Drosophila setifemur]
MIFLLLLVVVILEQSSSMKVQTEHTIIEEWSWRDSDGNGDSGGYEYSSNGNDDYTGEEDNDEEEEDDDILKGHANAFNLGEDEDEESCEYSCPRYYRPVCVLRNGDAITIATPCEFYNKVRCSNVQKSRGIAAPTFNYQHDGPC